MGAKYTATSVSGYNASPPSDDGSVSEANKVKWSTIKTKLPDPIKTALESIDTKLTTWAAYGPTEITQATAIGAADNEKFSEVSTACTLTIDDASTLGAGWMHYVVNTSAGSVTLKRTTGGDTIDGTAADSTVLAGQAVALIVNAAANGFRRFAKSVASATAAVEGIVELATAAETLTGTDFVRATTPSGLAFNSSLGVSGYYKFPGGFIIQWGNNNASLAGVPVSFPTAFTTACYGVVVGSGNQGDVISTINVNVSGFTFVSNTGTAAHYWLAIGK